MKKTTILAAFLVATAVVTAGWFGREAAVDNEQAAVPVADAQASSSPESADLTPEPDVEQTESPLDAPSIPSGGPAKLFSIPDFSTVEYRNAYDRAHAFLAEIRQPPVMRSQLIRANEAATNKLLTQFESNLDELSSSFDISAFGEYPCTISTIDDTDPEFAPGILVPAAYRVETKCDETGDMVTIGVERADGASRIVGIGIRSARFGGIGVKKFDESGYLIAFQMYPDSMLPRGPTVE